MSKYNLNEKKKAKRWWDDDGDRIGYEPGEVSGRFKRKKRVAKEEYSDWRQELSEILHLIEKEKNNEKIQEKKNIKNNIKINPALSESIEDLGGTLLEMVELDEIDYIIESVYDELLDEGYYEDDIESAIEYALVEAKVTYGHDTLSSPEKKKKGILSRAKERLSSIKTSIKKRIGRGAESVARKAQYVAHRMSRETPSEVHSKTGTRTPSVRSGISGGKRIEIAGRPKPKSTEPSVKKVSVVDVTPKKKESPVGTSENPRTGYTGSESKSVSKTPTSSKTPKNPKAKTKKTTVKTKPKNIKSTVDDKLDDLLASIRSEQTQLSEKITAKTDIGTAIKDFYASKSPTLSGRSKEERRKAAIAAVLTARRGGVKN